jgi:uncharacterized protein (TIGR02246 family)
MEASSAGASSQVYAGVPRVVAAPPDAAQRLARTEPVAAEHPWAAVCLARARQDRDPDAVVAALTRGNGRDARFERACTLVLLPGREPDGRAELRAAPGRLPRRAVRRRVSCAACRGGEMTVEDDVRAVSAAWAAALVRNDAALVAGFMTDDWVYVGPTGSTPKADVIGSIASGRLAHHTMTVVGGERVVRAGDAVLVTARKASSGTWDGAPYMADEWISEIYVRADGAWRCALSQKTPAAGSA